MTSVLNVHSIKFHDLCSDWGSYIYALGLATVELKLTTVELDNNTVELDYTTVELHLTTVELGLQHRKVLFLKEFNYCEGNSSGLLQTKRNIFGKDLSIILGCVFRT